jgi:pyruvate,water dikinase
VLALLPGYQVNRRFMEQMMGVKEGCRRSWPRHRRGRARRVLMPSTARTIAGLAVNHLTLNRRIDAFYARLDRALAPPAAARRAPIDELVAHYRELRGQLLLQWTRRSSTISSR